MCHGRVARWAAIFQRELCEGVLIGLKNYMTRHRRMRDNEQFYSDGCDFIIEKIIMILPIQRPSRSRLRRSTS